MASCNLGNGPKDTLGEVKALNIHDEITIGEIQKAFEDGEYTIVELTQFYLDRIQSIDRSGPTLNSVLTVNPDALSIARELDEERKRGRTRGPLHGIPVLLKDNIDTADKMPTTAGSRVMKDSYPLIDSPVAAQLREAGAILLGKTNLSEWANFHSSYSSSGWSGLGGQTKNPYDLSRNPCGSSSGSGAAVAANLGVLAIGTETNGSIVCPSNNNGIVGIKPTVGLISRTGIIPISFNQDSPGPMARTVMDATICLGTLTDVDNNDSKTTQMGREAYADYTQFLKKGSLKGKRLGYWATPLRDNVRMTKVMEEAITYFRENGAEIIVLDNFIYKSASDHSFEVLLYEFKDGLNKYLGNLGEKAPAKNLEEVIVKTFSDSLEMKYFDHELLKMASVKGNLKDKEYRTALGAMFRITREEGIDRIMNENDLDAIFSATGGPAWKTDLTNGDNFSLASSDPSAMAGYPVINVPMGHLDGLPVGISFFGRAWSEPILLAIAYDYEQGTLHRRTPRYLTSQE